MQVETYEGHHLFRTLNTKELERLHALIEAELRDRDYFENKSKEIESED